jgi:hypothetical protein
MTLEQLAKETVNAAFGSTMRWGRVYWNQSTRQRYRTSSCRGVSTCSVRSPSPWSLEIGSFDVAFRADLVVERSLLVELKSLETLLPVHGKQTLTYLRLMNLHLGLLINFGAPTFPKQRSADRPQSSGHSWLGPAYPQGLKPRVFADSRLRV